MSAHAYFLVLDHNLTGGKVGECKRYAVDASFNECSCIETSAKQEIWKLIFSTETFI